RNVAMRVSSSVTAPRGSVLRRALEGGAATDVPGLGRRRKPWKRVDPTARRCTGAGWAPPGPPEVARRAAVTEAPRGARCAIALTGPIAERPQELEHVLLLVRLQPEVIDDHLVRLARRVRRVTAVRRRRDREVRADRFLEVSGPPVVEEEQPL